MSQPVIDPYPPRIPPGENELPCSDGEPMETERHARQMTLLIESLAWGLRRDDLFVAGNMFLYFSETQARHNDFRGPDVFVVLGTTRRMRKSWVVWEEDGKVPNVVIELTSPSTVKVDRGEKKRIYARTLKVFEYYLFDPETKVFEGFILDPGSGDYVPKVPNERGWLSCEQLGLWLGKLESGPWDMREEWLRWIDRTGVPLLHSWEAGDEQAARADAEAARADAEAARANAEAVRADAEAARADAAAARILELERELIALRAKER